MFTIVGGVLDHLPQITQGAELVKEEIPEPLPSSTESQLVGTLQAGMV